jgi:hypothetical protein
VDSPRVCHVYHLAGLQNSLGSDGKRSGLIFLGVINV